MKRVIVAVVTTATAAAVAGDVLVGLGTFNSDDLNVTDKPRPPQIVITR